MAIVRIVVRATEVHHDHRVFEPVNVGHWFYTMSLPMDDWDEDLMTLWTGWDGDDTDEDSPRYGHPLATGYDTDGAVSWK